MSLTVANIGGLKIWDVLRNADWIVGTDESEMEKELAKWFNLSETWEGWFSHALFVTVVSLDANLK